MHAPQITCPCTFQMENPNVWVPHALLYPHICIPAWPTNAKFEAIYTTFPLHFSFTNISKKILSFLESSPIQKPFWSLHFPYGKPLFQLFHWMLSSFFSLACAWQTIVMQWNTLPTCVQTLRWHYQHTINPRCSVLFLPRCGP